MCPIFVASPLSRLARQQKILQECSFGSKNLLHFTCHTTKFNNCHHHNVGRESVCHPFKMLASRTKIYVAFLNNYQKALESLHRCTEAYPPFADLTRSIKLRSVKGQRQGQSLSLEDLLHKPVGRIQKHCLCLQVRMIVKINPFF